jgi:hypothetical protein
MDREGGGKAHGEHGVEYQGSYRVIRQKHETMDKSTGGRKVASIGTKGRRSQHNHVGFKEKS